MKSNKLKKIIAIAIASTMVSTIMPVTASAAWLKDTQNNWNWAENGTNVTGWKQVDGIWYHFDGNGKMQTGWVQAEDSLWYYMNSDGAMKTGWVQTADGKWYFMDASGAMQTGVIKVQEKVYAFEASGAMIVGSTVIGGETYMLDASGAVVGDKLPTPDKAFTTEGTVLAPPVIGQTTDSGTTTTTDAGTTTNTDTSSESDNNSSGGGGGGGNSNHHHSSSTINITTINGVVVPITGKNPVSTTIETIQYTAKIAWNGNPTTFVEGTVYTATITIIPRSGYTVSGVAANQFKVGGATTTNAANSGVITAVFPATAKTSEPPVTPEKPPVTPEKPDEGTTTAAVSIVEALDDIKVANGTTEDLIGLPKIVGVILSDGKHSTKAVSNWTSADYDETAEGIYLFTGDVADTTTKAEVNVIVGASAINVTAISGVTAPVTGATPVSTIAETTQYTATIAWNGTPTIFAGGTAYTATITITPKAGYTLSGVAANQFTVAGATTVANAANSGVVTAVFPATAATDATAPVVTGVTEGQAVVAGGSVTPASVDTDIATTALTKDGAAVAGYTLGTAVTGAGTYVLTVTDNAGNATVINFTIAATDTTAPVVTGVTEGQAVAAGGSVTPASVDTDIATTALTKDGAAVAGYTLGTAVTVAGTYVLTVTDNAGNATVINFTIAATDTTAPVVTGVTEGQAVAAGGSVTPASVDTDIATTALTKDGAAVAGYTLGTAVSGAGTYVLTVTDNAGNATVINFTIAATDATAPVVTGVTEGQAVVAGGSVTPASVDTDIATTALTKDGAAVAGYTLGTAVTGAGTYVLTVTDNAGNATVINFTIAATDTTAPVVTGVTEGQAVAAGGSVTPASVDTDIATTALTKDGAAVAGYTLGTAVTVAGTYVLTVTDNAGNATVINFTIAATDTTAPVVTGVTEGQAVAAGGSVTPASVDTDIATTALTKDGAAVAGYTLGTAVSGAGTYVLTVTDNAGNATVINFTIAATDATAPVVTGVTEGQAVVAGGSVTPASVDTDIATTALTKDGAAVAGYTLGTAVTGAGTYVLTVTDNAGNATVINFTIAATDTTAPVVTGVTEGQAVAAGGSVTPASVDTDIATTALTKDGAAVAGYTLGTAVTVAGTYVLTVTDNAGNATVINFTIAATDTTAPVVTGVTEGQAVAAGGSVTPASVDTDIATTALTKDGAAVAGYTLGTAVSGAGTYVLTVTDNAGNATVINFTIAATDATAPVVTGVTEGQAVVAGGSVTPASVDTDIATTALTKDGAAVAGYTLGTAVSGAGTYVLTVTDNAGNATVINFTIAATDATAPVVTGVTEGQAVVAGGSVTPASVDTDIATTALTKDGAAVAGYTLGTAVSGAGTYVLTVTDNAGNATVINFTIAATDATAPVVTGVTEGQAVVAGGSVTPASVDTDIATTALTKDGAAVAGYTLGTAVSGAGTYVLTVTDNAGNATVINFTIAATDATAPVVTGVTEGQAVVAGGSVTPASVDTDIATTALTKDGAAVAGYTLGTAVSGAGTYVLTVTDNAGNATVINFTIAATDATAPVVTGVTEGQAVVAGGSVTPASVDTDIATTALTKDGAAVAGYTLGTAVSGAGTYVLTVTDNAGNATVINFTIAATDATAPVVTGVTEGQAVVAGGSVTPASVDTDIATTALTKDGAAVAGYTLGTAVTGAGTYVLTVTDNAGNATVINFTIAATDTTAPVVTGVTEGQAVAAGGSVTPASVDTDIATTALTKDGAAVAGYTLGTAVSGAGTYVLTVTDNAGNATVINFTIAATDTTAPVVTGVTEGQAVAAGGSVTPASVDTDIATTALTKDGAAVAGYTLGTAVSGAGTYVLTVTDNAGNATVINFTIAATDATAPVVTGVTEGQAVVAGGSVTPASVDTDIATTALTKDGAAVAGYTLGTAVTVAGTYVLTVTDNAGNATVINFTIAATDTTAPVVTGVTEGQAVAAGGSVTPASVDTDIATTALTKDGAAVAGYTLGTAVSGAGTYVLTVTDNAGNATVINFTIAATDATAPVVTGVTEGQAVVAGGSVTPASVDTDIATTALTKDGSAVAGYTLGTAVSGAGTYVLTVTDNAGNATVINFTIAATDTTAPVVTGVTEGQAVAAGGSVTPASVDTDIATTALTKDGAAVAGYTLGTAVTVAGTYVLTVTDNAGNATVINFTIAATDATAPVVTGVTEGQAVVAGGSVTPASVDTDIATTALTKDGAAVAGYTLGTAVSGAGTYVLTVTDNAGNATVINFTIAATDATAPVVTGVTEGQAVVAGGSVTPASVDTDIATTALTKDGAAVAGYTLGTAVSGAGTYVLTVTDNAGNATVINFTIAATDATAPVVTGVTEGQAVVAGGSVTPASVDTDIATTALTKDGAAVAGYTLGTAVSGAGTYVLTVTDNAGNATVINFTIAA